MRRSLATLALSAALTLALAAPAYAHPNSCVTHRHFVWYRFWAFSGQRWDTWEISSKRLDHGPRYFVIHPGFRDGGVAPRSCW
jgi:hypothetical protein